jgi:hypothetical protein
MESRDAKNWAQSVETLTVGQLPAGVQNINVQGKRIMGPVHGFGQLWQKIYRLSMIGAQPAPEQVVAAWKANFPAFWPAGNKLFTPGGPIKPGDVGVINTSAGNVTMLTTGVYVIYADDVSFSFMTPEGHPWAGMITFGAESEGDATAAHVQVLVRANDPIYELGMRTFMSAAEDKFWFETLRNVGAHFGASGKPTLHAQLVDPKVQWREWKNVWQNAGVRTALHLASAPVRWAQSKLRRGSRT